MRVALVGDGIENPANAVMMVHAAEMFGGSCFFRDTKGLSQACTGPSEIRTITTEKVRMEHQQIIACDNLPGAKQVYGFRSGREFALMVGNERRGLSHELRGIATDCVEIPMHSPQVNCLNVAAASAVALYYLTRMHGGLMAERRNPASRRPDVLLFGPRDHFELGSTIRSAAAFGWKRIFISDTHQVWFGCKRETRAEGRAAARRGKNDIFVIPISSKISAGYEFVTVVTRQEQGIPLKQANLCRGPGQIVALPDESSRLESIDWERFGKKVEFVHLQMPVNEFAYHYRLFASIAMAESARQVGKRVGAKEDRRIRPPEYYFKLTTDQEEHGEIISFDELREY